MRNNLWNKYYNAILRNFVSVDAERDLVYWRNRLFAESMVYLLPFCLIALIPGVYWSAKTGLFLLAVLDMIIVTAIAIISIAKGISIRVRKLVFIVCVYVLSIVILYYIGLQGPGLIYLYAACVFGIFFFEKKYAYWFAVFNTLVCILMGAAIPLGLTPWPSDRLHSLNEWIAVTSNPVFLSFISAALIPALFTGLADTLEKQKVLTRALDQKQQSLEEAYRLLQKKNEDLEQFAYIASHDLQEPLRMVAGFLTQLEKKYESQLDEKGKLYIHYAVTGSKRMHQIIADLLEFSRAGREKGELKPVHVTAVINDVLLLLKKRIEEKKAIITVGPLPELMVHQAALHQVFQNLIDNALKYHDRNDPPHITISAEQLASHWQFTVADNGIGISPEFFDRIFMLFQRLHQRDEFSGTGVGLAICKKIIELLNGKIWVESEEQKGSRFRFTLPINPVM